ncbi:MAG: hypothetical protein OEY28_11625 [Nitrospira sp.]|nr:hypothetical protein [Nitrospira sp.]
MDNLLGALRRLNFKDLLKVDYQDIEHYTFDTYREHESKHYPIRGYCIACEQDGVSTATEDPNFHLTNISHGAHSTDFIRALSQRPDTTDWHQEPVVFIYESSSLDYDIYKEVLFNGYRKRPAKEWYWIHNEQKPAAFPHAFKRSEYGDFVMSAIQTFRLSNAYMTNLVKCGLNNENGQFKGIESFNEQCIKNCFSLFLSREIELLKPQIIFAVGAKVEGLVSSLVGKQYFVQQLPHPAGRYLRDEHCKVLYFWLVLRALHKVGIVGIEEARNLSETFLINYENLV